MEMYLKINSIVIWLYFCVQFQFVFNLAFNFSLFVSAFQMEFLLLIISSSLLGIKKQFEQNKTSSVFFIVDWRPTMLPHASKASHEADYPHKGSVTWTKLLFTQMS